MKYHVLHPEIAGGLGPGSVLDAAVHPPRVSRLHYEFADWLGDALVETFPVFVIRRDTGEDALAAGLTGAELAPVEISVSEEGREIMEMTGAGELPEWRWLKVHGAAGIDDFGQLADATLVVSERALALLRESGLEHCRISPYDPGS